MKTRFAVVTTTAALGLLTHDAHAAGIALDVQSARGTGMASALTAATDGSDSIFYNPAGIARGKVFDAQVGVTLIAPTFSYKNTAGKETTMPFSIVPPPNAYVSGGITENLSVGIGLFTPYGLTLKWPSGWDGRRQIEEASLRTFYVNPTVAYRVGPVRIGAGFQLVRATVELKRAIGAGTTEAEVDLGAGAWGAGGNAGVQVDAIEKYLTFGATYRSAVKIDFDGNAHFSNVPRELSSTLHDQSVSTSLTQPDQLAFGLASHPLDGLLLDADIVWLGWGKFRSIDLSFPDDKTGTLSSSQAKSWSSKVNYHLGGEGALSDNWRLRAGVLYDPSPSPSDTLTPDVPDADRVNLAIGGSYHHSSGVHVDLGYQFLILVPKTSTAPAFPGEYAGNVNILGISVGYATPKEHHSKEALLPPPDPMMPTDQAPPSGAAPAPETGSPAAPAPMPNP